MSLPINDPVAFPRLSADEIAALHGFGDERAVETGEILFAEGDRDFCFFVVLEGAIEIVEHSSGVERQVVDARTRRIHR